jgi:hypothetical protein
MPAIANLVAAISTDVVARLGALTPAIALAGGKILIGNPNLIQHQAPPRIVFVPKGCKWEGGGPPALGGTDNVSGFPSAGRIAQQRARALRTEIILFEVHAWGLQPGTYDPNQPELDFDATQVLYQTLIQSVHNLAVGTYGLGDGKWTSAKLSTTQLDVLGQEFIFDLSFRTPVQDLPAPLVPHGTAPATTTKLSPASGGTPETGCTG